ncbi:hypothetical protein CAI21_13190 [Alkalilimnicola ehrlichii]|uniref:LysM domain-containing protein n=1 Tax=Alkalilimnicola ehrlichii TaxID=351052 RepID=A0A3E0WPW4_9GAMM|nr:peptidoglycan DD-metalloendopeptidase family protein [Alkalilimnicola ehrlichii]RFA28267.1 hypothetical protein CAI21_13190 [Alkalilimnicola ehrlichii]RFA34868.1 hypothetical protein CAL65_14325 [Alkalilimnicola ehrlichii]
MRYWFGLTVLAAVLAALSGCASFSAGGDDIHVVQRGDTLYSIAWRNNVDYRTVARINHIEPPYVIYPGQRLRLHSPGGGRSLTDGQRPETQALASGSGGSGPRPLAPHQRRSPQALGRPLRDDQSRQTASAAPSEPPRSAPAPEERQTTAAAPPQTPASRPAESTASAQATTRPRPPAPTRPSSPPRSSGGDISWQWPTDGGISKAFSASADGKRGVNINGQIGQAVRAAADGRVVYSGSGLRGYGNLIIVKHDGRYLTAYGYNNQLLVTEGDTVSAGQRIATMGMGSGGGPALHFELRRDGEAVDPVGYLPKR